MSERHPHRPTPRPDPLLQAYDEAERLLGAEADPGEAVRERVLAAALAAQQAAAAPPAMHDKRREAANAPQWRWAAFASVCTLSLAGLLAVQVQLETAPDEALRPAPAGAGAVQRSLPAAQPGVTREETAASSAPDTAAAALAKPAAATPPARAAATARPREIAPDKRNDEPKPLHMQRAPAAQAEGRADSEQRERQAVAASTTAPAPEPAAAAAPARLPAPAAPVPAPAAVAAAPLADQDLRPLLQSREAAAAARVNARAVADQRARSEVAKSESRADTNALLLSSASAGRLDAVKQALASGADINAVDAQGRTAITAAAYGNHAAVVRALIAAGADLERMDATRNNAFHIAAVRGHLEVLRTMIAAGVNVNSLNRYGGTALIPAAHHGHVAIVRELLQTTSINRNHVNDLGWTALLEAVILGDGGARHTEIVKLLLAQGADPNIADRNGVTPLQHARQRGYTSVATAIETAGGR